MWPQECLEQLLPKLRVPGPKWYTRPQDPFSLPVPSSPIMARGMGVTLVPTAWILFQGPPDSGRCSAASCLDAFNDLDVDDLDVLRTRHARHSRKRRRLV